MGIHWSLVSLIKWRILTSHLTLNTKTPGKGQCGVSIQCTHSTLYAAYSNKAAYRVFFYILNVVAHLLGFLSTRYSLYGWIGPLHLKKKINKEAASDDRWRWSLTVEQSLCWPPYRNSMMSALYAFPQASSSSAPLFPLCYIYTHTCSSYRHVPLLLGTLGRFSPQWPLILSCKTQCRGILSESSAKHKLVFRNVSSGRNEAHFKPGRKRNG